MLNNLMGSIAPPNGLHVLRTHRTSYRDMCVIIICKLIIAGDFKSEKRILNQFQD